MKKGSKILLAAATIWPFLYFLLFMGVFVLSFIARDNGPGLIWAIIIPLHLLTMLLIVGLIAFYIVNIFRNDRVNKDMKVLWAVVIFMGNVFAMTVYWYLYIWRALPASSGQPQLGAELDSPFSTQTGTITPEVTYAPPSQPPDWR